MKNPIVFGGRDWYSVKQRLLEKQDLLMQKLLDTSKDHGETQVIRGQLLIIREMMNWEREPDNSPAER